MQKCPGGRRIVLPALQHWSREVHNWSREVLAHKSQAPRQRASPADLGWAAGPARASLVATFWFDYILGYLDQILVEDWLGPNVKKVVQKVTSIKFWRNNAGRRVTWTKLKSDHNCSGSESGKVKGKKQKWKKVKGKKWKWKGESECTMLGEGWPGPS